MKITKQCPECGGNEIYTTATSMSADAASLLPNIGGTFTFPKVDVYVCGNCGLHQMFVKNETLQMVKKKYTRHK